jgi:hypothetical protein
MVLILSCSADNCTKPTCKRCGECVVFCTCP